ncbi:MAG: SigE family RNA polymerase sigma factor [Acidimicrobiales bacterium]
MAGAAAVARTGTAPGPPPVAPVTAVPTRRPEPRVSGTAGDFEHCVEQWTAELARLAFLLTGDHHAADDLVADALLSAWRQWPSVTAATNPKAYVRRIVVNQAASRVRTAQRGRKGLRLLSGLTRETAPAADVSERLDMRRALERLPRGQRLCLVLRHGLDLSESEVAEVLQISIGTVKSQTFKGIRQLRHLLEQQG